MVYSTCWEPIVASQMISAKQQMRAAQAFNFFSIIAVVIPPLIAIWIAASIFVYAAVANHPNPEVRKYLIPSGYRFYGLTGSLVAVLNFSQQLSKWVGGGYHLIGIIWALSLLVVVPLGVRDIIRAKNAPWQDMTVENAA